MARRTSGRGGNDGGWGPYVSVAEKRAKATREAAKQAKKRGETPSPVVIEGRTIARTFWGEAWCENLERYSDLANRLPRGRAYVRNGSVVDLRVLPGEVTALVAGSEPYRVVVRIEPVPDHRWRALRDDCAGAVDSLVELLQGRLSKAVMERVCRQRVGLFPAPAEISMRCSCPDGATMCKHVAAVLYGIGARLDEQPELLFRLRRVDETELVAHAAGGTAFDARVPAAANRLEDDDLSGLFGVEMAETIDTAPPRTPVRAAAKRSRRAPVPAPETPPATPTRPPPATPPLSSDVAKGSPVRMLAGVHAGRSGRVTWVKPRGDRFTYGVTVETGAGKATTQVSSSSLGRMWEVAPA